MKTIKIIDLFKMSNKPKKIKYKNHKWNLTNNTYDNEKIAIDLDVYLASVQICDLGRSFVEVLNDKVEIIEEILDAKEKEYLSNVIRPFRVDYIKKRKTAIGQECIEIRTYDVNDFHYTITFPNFKENTMYKNMEADKGYSLEELGL